MGHPQITLISDRRVLCVELLCAVGTFLQMLYTITLRTEKLSDDDGDASKNY